HHVVGAELDPVERPLDRRPRRAEITLSPAKLAQERSVQADALRLGRAGDRTLTLIQGLLGQLLVAPPQRQLSLPQKMKQPHAAGLLARAGVERLTRSGPVPEVE